MRTTLIETTQGRKHRGNLGLDGMIILKCVVTEYGVSWIQLAQDKDQWRTLLNMGLKLRIP